MKNRGQVLIVLFVLWLVLVGGNSVLYTMALSVRLLHHLIMTLVFIVWIWRRGLPQMPISGALALSFGVVIAGALFSPIDRRMALENAWFWLNHALLFLLLVDWQQRGYGRALLRGHYIAGLLLVVGGIAEFMIQPGDRVSSGFLLINLLGMYAAPLAVLAVGEMPAASGRARWFYRVLFVGLAAILVANNSRGALLSLFVGLAALAALRGSISRRMALAGAAAAVVGLLLIVATSFMPDRQYGDTIRADLWRSAVHMIGDHQWFGVGLGLFGAAYNEHYSTRPEQYLLGAHNLVLNVLAELGVVGAFAGAVVVGLWLSEFPAKLSDQQKVALAALIGVGVHLLVDYQSATNFAALVLVLASTLVVQDVPAQRARLRPALRAVVVIVLVFYLGALLRFDAAQAFYEHSIVDDRAAFSSALRAVQLDPDLWLYRVQLAHAAVAPDTVFSDALQMTRDQALIAYGRYWR